jgi:hypothetical protein
LDGCAWNSCSTQLSSLVEVWLRARPQNFCVRGSILVAWEFSLASYSSLSLSLVVIFSNRAEPLESWVRRKFLQQGYLCVPWLLETTHNRTLG